MDQNDGIDGVLCDIRSGPLELPTRAALGLALSSLELGGLAVGHQGLASTDVDGSIDTISRPEVF